MNEKMCKEKTEDEKIKEFCKAARLKRNCPFEPWENSKEKEERKNNGKAEN